VEKEKYRLVDKHRGKMIVKPEKL